MAATVSTFGASPARQQERIQKLDRLALLYEGILTAILRVQNRRQVVDDIEAFRSRMKQALREISDSAARRGYSSEDVREANFAVVAFLDETILSSQDSGSTQWAGKSLGEELFGHRSAGELFFKHLETLRANRDSGELAEVLEVYYLCLLLGYEGKFAGEAKAELQLLITNLRERIERIFGRNPELSPDAALPDEALPLSAPAVDPLHRQITLFAIAALVFAIVCFVGFSIHLSSQSADVEHTIQQHMIR